MRILAMTTGDFRTADSGMRLRDFHLCSALTRLGDLDVLTFRPHQATAAEPRHIDARVMVDAKPSRPGALVASLLRGELYHRRLFDPRRHRDFAWCFEQAYDMIHCSAWYSVPAAEELRRATSPGAPIIWDTHNFDPDVWNSMADTAQGMRRWFAARQAKLALDAAVAAARSADAVLAATDDDADKLRHIAPARVVHVVANGGEVLRWSRAAARTEPRPRSCVIFGGMRQDSTRRGVEWFLDRVWPRIVSVEPDSRLIVAGRDPARSLVREVDRTPGASIVANPDDIAALVASAEVVALPQIWGTGSKIKMFEAVATGRRVVASPAALIGIPAELHRFVVVEDRPGSWAGAILSGFGAGTPSAAASRARRDAVADFDWSKRGRHYEELVRDLLGKRG